MGKTECSFPPARPGRLKVQQPSGNNIACQYWALTMPDSVQRVQLKKVEFRVSILARKERNSERLH